MTGAVLQRYQEICLMLHTRPHGAIEHALATYNRANANTVVITVLPNAEQPDYAALVTDEDVKPLAFLIKELKDKTFRLNLHGQRISDKGASVLASIFQVTGNLASLLLPFNEIRDEGAGAFGASFTSSVHLPAVLDLTGNPISDEGVALLFRGFALRPHVSARTAAPFHLRLRDTKATVASEAAVAEGLLTGVLTSLAFTPVTDNLRGIAFEVAADLVECDVTSLAGKVAELEQACAFPLTHDARMKRLTVRVQELEKKLQEGEEREKQLVKRITFLEENVAREQDQCVKLLRQCSKLVCNNGSLV